MNEDNKPNLESGAATLGASDAAVVEKPLAKKAPIMDMSDAPAYSLEKSDYSNNVSVDQLQKVIQAASGQATKKAPSLALTEIPNANSINGLTKVKRGLIPDSIIKQIRVADHLVAAILRSRGNLLSLYGHLRKDRFDIGIEVEIRPEFLKVLNAEQHTVIVSRIKRFEKILLNCGHTAGLEPQDMCSLADYFDVQTRNGLSFGRMATEVIYDRESAPDENGQYPFNRFRARDVGTMERAARSTDTGEVKNLREKAIQTLQQMTGEVFELNTDIVVEDKAAWIQKIDGIYQAAFTANEMLVYNFFESTDVEHNGYPVTPLDTVLVSITTHIAIDKYKEMYFTNGRASKGMLVINSDEIDDVALNNLKLQFNASVNSVSNSFRTPIFGISNTDSINWVPMSGEGLEDGSFQFMYDQIARNILSAFNVSPDELSAYGQLSRPTGGQTMSESSNEYKLTASRDSGLRPLILKFQTFLNTFLFPIIDPSLAKICRINLAGLDAQSKDQESTRLQQDQATHMGYDDVLNEVDKDPIGKAFGGAMPFNERIRLVFDGYMDVGQIKGHFMNSPAATVDPLLRYKRDAFWLQNLQLLSQLNPAAVQALFAPRPYALDLLKMEIEDSFED
jgi:hypothetical protein